MNLYIAALWLSELRKIFRNYNGQEPDDNIKNYHKK